MAVLNSYNYSKPKNFVNVNIKPLEDSKGDSPIPVDKKVSNDQVKTNQYLEQRVISAKPEELTYMLYEGLVKFIKKAILALEERDIEATHINAMRAFDIVVELRNSLNMDIPMSKELDQLYDYLEFKLFNANIDKDKKLFEESLVIAVEFKNVWKEAFDIA